MERKGPALNIAFESGQLTYGDLEVDLYNSGINQILSVAAARRHTIYHFSMADLYLHQGAAYARMSVLSLPDSWEGDPLKAYPALRRIEERSVPLSELQLCFLRADDIRTRKTKNLGILERLAEYAILVESIDATLSTCDKYEIVRRTGSLPHPTTFTANAHRRAMEAISKVPNNEGWFVLKDRFGYGCGAQVHRLSFDSPGLENLVREYLHAYGSVLIQEYCPEVKDGDLVVSFFDDQSLGALRRTAREGEWKTNFNLGAEQSAYTLTPEQERIAREVRRAFPECRVVGIDMLPSGKILEINTYPGGEGLLRAYGVELGMLVLNRFEEEVAARGVLKRAPLTIPDKVPPGPPSLPKVWSELEQNYERIPPLIEVIDVMHPDKYLLPARDLIVFRPRSSDFVLSVPHAGTLLPTQFQENFELKEKDLLEIDLFSDLLYEDLSGFQVISRLAPFFVDFNRELLEGGQTGALPYHLRNAPQDYYTIEDRPILKKKYTAEQEREVLQYYELYHNLMQLGIDYMRRERGYALVIDGHSMSAEGLGRVHDTGKERAHFVVGTLGDTSAHTAIIDAFVETLRQISRTHGLSLSVAKNTPYSGGFITRKHNRPDDHVHAIQIEVAMDTYMYEAADDNVAKRYALKQPRVRIVQDTLRRAIRGACDAAERVYSRK